MEAKKLRSLYFIVHLAVSFNLAVRLLCKKCGVFMKLNLCDLDFLDRVEQERKYKEYLVWHNTSVEENFHRFIEPLRGKFSKDVDSAIDICGNNLILHDLSKLSKSEFDPYRRHFYPTKQEKSEEEDLAAYNLARKHHVENNPHHAIYWNKDGIKREMSLEYIFEMLCDWASVGKWVGDKSLCDWYDHDAIKEKKSFTDNTQKKVDFYVDLIFRKPGIKF